MTQTKRKKTDYIIQSVDHALDVLEAFHGEEDELGITELSRRLKLHKNNIFRIHSLHILVLKIIGVSRITAYSQQYFYAFFSQFTLYLIPIFLLAQVLQ